MKTFPLRPFLHLFALLLLCACCSCQATKSHSSSVAPPKATTDAERLGDSLMETGRIEQAVAEYDKALSAGADKASIAYRKGFAYFNEGKWDKALELFQDAIGTDPSMAIAYEGAGIASFQLGYFDQASDYLIDVMERAPNHWVPYAFMAGILAAQKNFNGSREMHKKALEIAGQFQSRQVNTLLAETYKRGEQLVRTGKYKPGKTVRSKSLAAQSQENGASPNQDQGASNVYRSVKTLSPEEKAKIQEEMLARLKNPEAPPATPPQSAPEQSARAAQQPTAADLQLAPLDEGEAQALLRALKTGQIKEKLATAEATDTTEVAATAEITETAEAAATAEITETTEVIETAEAVPSSPRTDAPAPAATPSESDAPAPSDSLSFVSSATPLVTAPDMDTAPAGGLLRDLPESGYSAMVSSFPNYQLSQARAKELQAKGLDPYVAPVDLGDRGTWYRVLFGPFSTRKEAKTMRRRLAKQFGCTDAIVLKHTQN